MRDAKPVAPAIAQTQAPEWGLRISLAALSGLLRFVVVGVAAFVSGTLLAALPSTRMLITSRTAQATAAAMLAPATFFLLRTMFSDPEQRSLAISIWTYSLTLGAAVGSPLCGFVDGNGGAPPLSSARFA